MNTTARKMDRDGRLLCDLQARTFELSTDNVQSSSEIFIRRFMNSRVVTGLDNGAILETNLRPSDLLDRIDEQYGQSSYGSVKYTHNEMHWIGYIYRCMSYTYNLTSRQAYKKIKPRELRGLYLPYHTLDPAQAVERILEAKNIPRTEEEEFQRQYEIFRKMRMS